MKHIEADNQKEESALKSFGHALLYSALEQPYEGLAQIANHVAKKEVCPPQALTAAPVPAKFRSANWYAQTVGGAIGTAANFIVLSRLLGPSSSAAMTQVERLQGMSTMQMVGVGFVQQSIFAPSQADHMWAGRVKNGLTGAITVAALKSLSEGLNGASRSAAGITTPGLRLPLGEKIANDMIAGSAAGGLGAETHSLLYGHGNARWEDIVHGSYSFAIVGGALGAVQTGRSVSAAKVDNYVSSTAYAAEASPLRSTLFTSFSRTQAEPVPAG